MNEVTRFSNAARHGDPNATAQLLPLVYDELHRLAAAKSPDLVLGTARRQRAGLTRPLKSAGEYLATLEQCRLPETASRFRQHVNEI